MDAQSTNGMTGVDQHAQPASNSLIPPVLDVGAGLPLQVLEHFQAASDRWRKLPAIFRAILEFRYLLSLNNVYMERVIKNMPDPAWPEPEVVAMNAIFNVQRGRDQLLTMIPNSLRQIAAGRLDRAVEVFTRLLASMRGVPRSRLYDETSNRLFEGPWVPIFYEMQQADGDVVGILSLFQQLEDDSKKVKALGRDPAAASNEDAMLSYTQSDLDGAIRKYKAERSAKYAELKSAIQAGSQGAYKAARKLFGRNAIANALRVKAKAMVSKSPEWQAIAIELKLNGRSRGKPKGRVGLGHVLEIAAQESETPAEAAARNELRRRLQRLPADIHDSLVKDLEAKTKSVADLLKIVAILEVDQTG